MSRGPGAVQREILDALELGPRSTDELVARLGRRRDLVRRALDSLVQAGRASLTADRASLTAPHLGGPLDRARLVSEVHEARVYHASWRALLAVVPSCDALIVDAPFSARTHQAHDAAAEDANRGADYRSRVDAPTGGTGPRRALGYGAWSDVDVRAFVSAWAPRVRGWIVSLTDHVLAPVWAAALKSAGRYAFAPLPCVVRGGRVRLLGDGPSSIADYAVVARPRSSAYSKWGTLPGEYSGTRERMPLVGGKPLWLMRALVADYTRPGDLIVDPCCGAGTTLRAALELGRGAIGGDVNLAHAHLAAARCAEPLPVPEAEAAE